MDEKLMMTARPFHIVMQAYGQEGILQECLFVLFSFVKNHSIEEQRQFRFHIYTDKKEWFSQFKDCPLDVHFHEINATKLKLWRGAIDFVHRVKIEVLRDFVKQVEGAILYLDTDVYFTGSLTSTLERIAQGKLFMHVSEGKLNSDANPMMEKLHRFFGKTNTFTINGKTVVIPLDTVMWNAGVLGFNTDLAPILDEVLSFTDTVHKQFPKHIVEQFAFSYFFAQKAQVRHTAQSIVHYWILSEIKVVLGSFFEYFKGRSWDELVRYSSLVQHSVIVQEKTSFFINRSVMGKIQQLKWQPAIPDWTALLKQM